MFTRISMEIVRQTNASCDLTILSISIIIIERKLTTVASAFPKRIRYEEIAKDIIPASEIVLIGQLTVLRYTNVSASKPLRVIGRSIRPRKATDAISQNRGERDGTISREDH